MCSNAARDGACGMAFAVSVGIGINYFIVIHQWHLMGNSAKIRDSESASPLYGVAISDGFYPRGAKSGKPDDYDAKAVIAVDNASAKLFVEPPCCMVRMEERVMESLMMQFVSSLEGILRKADFDTPSGFWTRRRTL